MKKRLVDADKLMERAKMNSVLVTVEHDHHDYGLMLGTLNKIVKECELPSAQPETHDKRTESHACDCISRQAAIDCVTVGARPATIRGRIAELPSAQPEQRCVNCGRTVNNGGWYEDGRTRCPIEEHYALPKDGYCHLWEKRKDWEDDYVKRAEEGEK